MSLRRRRPPEAPVLPPPVRKNSSKVKASNGVTDTPRSTSGEMMQRKELALQLIRAGASASFIRAELVRRFSITESQSMNAYSATLRDLADAYEADLASTKASQVERLMNDAVWMRAQRNAGDNGRPVVDYNHHALVQTERLLAQVQGTLAPLKVKVDESAEMRSGLIALVSSLSSDEVMQLAEQQEEYERATRH